MTDSDTFIHQTLHGYREGHRLLAASTTLPPRSEQLLAVLSDLSGHVIVRHFGEYLTGYPLPEFGVYALAKTWYAPEMPRPGCVWTHTLLIPFEKLGRAQSLHIFASLFVRPHSDDFNSFTIPLREKSENDKLAHTTGDRSIASQVGGVLRKLYESPDQPILVPIGSPEKAEWSFLEIWSQQWPRLRRTFTFCTGAISSRQVDGRWFDLQGVPEKRIDDLLRTNNNAVIAKLGTGQSGHQKEHWCQMAIDDLVFSTNGLRKFLFEFAAETRGGRRDFIPMTNLFLALNNKSRDPVKSLINSLEVVFPQSDMGVKLKGKLLAGEVGTDLMRTPDVPLRIVLEAKEKLFEMNESQLNDIAQRAWAFKPDRVFEAVSAADEAKKVLSPAVLSAIAETLKPEYFTDLSKFEEALLILASHRPMILAHDSFRAVSGRNAILLEYLKGRRIKPDEIQTILRQWLKEGEFECFDLGAETIPTRVIPNLLDLVSGITAWGDSNISTGQLIHLCKRGPKQAEGWLFQNIERLKKGELALTIVGCIVVALDIETIRLKNNNVDDWEFLLFNQKELELELQDMVVVRLFLRAMQVRGTSGARIATAAFPHIYRRLMNSEISYSEWYTLQEALIGTSWDWDRCRQLTESLIDQFRAFKWPKKYFSVMLANDAELASYLKNTCFCGSKYKKYISRSLK